MCIFIRRDLYVERQLKRRCYYRDAAAVADNDDDNDATLVSRLRLSSSPRLPQNRCPSIALIN